MPKTPIAVQNLGPVTSYAEAVAGGFRGTREEYRAALAELGKNVVQVADDRKRAEAAAAGAVSARDRAETAAGAAAASAERAEQSVANGAYMSTYVGEDGCLYFERTENLTGLNLSIVDGDLILEVD